MLVCIVHYITVNQCYIWRTLLFTLTAPMSKCTMSRGGESAGRARGGCGCWPPCRDPNMARPGRFVSAASLNRSGNIPLKCKLTKFCYWLETGDVMLKLNSESCPRLWSPPHAITIYFHLKSCESCESIKFNIERWITEHQNRGDLIKWKQL